MESPSTLYTLETIQISALGKECPLCLVNVYISLGVCVHTLTRAHAHTHLRELVTVSGTRLFSKAHASIPAWRIPRTKEAGGLQSTGSQRIRHD